MKGTEFKMKGTEFKMRRILPLPLNARSAEKFFDFAFQRAPKDDSAFSDNKG